ncbi:ProQ/FINO family protein [Enterobacter sp. JBIWA005]|uniref:ProQ/FINO family protein n=1 Tax=Enterobacter sp. JBIWA005 TaxID=2831891 RepID=UPI001CC1B5D4|nr:ProQ/FINO family protein [Enterobacter sp. JBIWA005]UAN34364.1 ProQ/FinO family protein [Enterobacter sp. JBIWA005]
MATQDEKQQQQREFRALLEGFWPGVFSFSKPKPLRVGILTDMVTDAEARGLPFGHDVLKAAVKLYTLRYGYQLAVSRSAERYDLRGEVDGVVTDEQKARALEELKRRDARKRQKRATEAEKGAKPSVMHQSA